MLYRFALALGLLALGIHFGREVHRNRSTRSDVPGARLARNVRSIAPRMRKASLH